MKKLFLCVACMFSMNAVALDEIRAIKPATKTCKNEKDCVQCKLPMAYIMTFVSDKMKELFPGMKKYQG